MLKKVGVTREFQLKVKLIFFYFISPQGENIFTKIWGMVYKNILRKKHVSYAVTGLYRNYDVSFHQQEK